MRFYRFALSALCVALICPAHAEEAGAEAPPARRAAVIVYPVSRRPQEHLAAPGEWLVIADRHGLWMPHFFADAPTQTYHKRGSEVYLRRQVGRDELVGVQMKSLTGRLEVRSALAAKTDPLTIWAYASVIPEIPALPPGGRYALAVDGVSDLRPLTRLRGLTALKLGCAPGVTDLAPLAALTELDSLWLSGADASDLAPLAALPKLRVLRIDLCKGVTDLSPLARLKNLRLLDLDCSGAPTNAAALARLRHLNVLVVRRCPSLLDLAPIAQLDGLNWLGLHGCPLVADLAPLRRLPRLATLEVEACPGVSDLAPLASMATLEGLSLRACPKVADISPLATLPRLVRMEVVDCPRVMDLWPLRRAAQQPHNFSVDWRLGDEAALNAQASPGKVTLLMDGRYVSSVAMPPEAIGEDDGWGNLLSRSIVPPAGLPEGVQELPYPVAPDQADSVLNFTLEGPRVFLSDPHGPRRLAGVVACSHESRLALQQALAEGAKGLLVWATADAIKSLPPFPPGSDCTLVVLGFRPSIEPLGRVKNLAGLYVAHASDQPAPPHHHQLQRRERGHHPRQDCGPVARGHPRGRRGRGPRRRSRTSVHGTTEGGGMIGWVDEWMGERESALSAIHPIIHSSTHPLRGTHPCPTPTAATTWTPRSSTASRGSRCGRAPSSRASSADSTKAPTTATPSSSPPTANTCQATT